MAPLRTNNLRARYLIYAVLLVPGIFLCRDKAEAPAKAGAKLPDTVLQIGDLDIKTFFPTPHSLFAAMDQVGNADWNNLIDFSAKQDYKTSADLALNIGARSADGICFIYARKYQEATDTWVALKNLIEPLGLSASVENYQARIKQAIADKNDAQIRATLGEVHSRIEKELRDSRDDDLAIMVNLGGWLEGLYILSGTVKKDFNPRIARLMGVSALLENFENAITKMNETNRANAKIQAILAAIPRLKTLTRTTENAPAVSRENALEVQAITARLRKTIIE